jgi:XrtN system VIT domain protein
MNEAIEKLTVAVGKLLRADIALSTFMLGISGAIFIFPDFLGGSEESKMAVFFLTYLIAVAYFIMMRFAFGKRERALSHEVFTVLLFLISAYALNREMNVFLESVDWQVVLLVLTGVAMILSCFFNILPMSINLIISVILGFGAVLFIYLACYVSPLYFISVPLLLALGISIHSFVPIMVLIVLWKIVSKMRGHNNLNFLFFVGGFSISILAIILFAFSWTKLNHDVKLAYHQHDSKYVQHYPSWVTLAQRLPNDWLTKRFLKTNLVYSEGEMMSFMPNFNSNFNERRVHDPLVLIAQLFSKVEISNDDKIKVLETIHDARHQAQEQYWRGDRLSTSNILTNVRIYPAYRLAYTEKTLDIHYKSEDRWNDPQEALYTFYLPEGSVVSSLSLWVNGKEEKGYLTTKAKADSAYKTIVDKESHVLARDPSVVHWQEGNAVSVRVFPCLPEADRKVKVGFTTPLLLKNNALIYQSIYFKGVTPKSAKETIQVKIEDYKDKKADFSFSFEAKPDDFFLYEGGFKPYWEIELAEIPLAKTQFSFQGKAYKLLPYQQKSASVDFREIYLDLNSSWARSEIENILEMGKNQKIYVWNEYKMLEINPQNLDLIYKEIRQWNFSLFPFYKIKNPEKALIITKSEKPAPNLKDLKDSPFANAMVEYLPQHAPIRLFSLSEILAPYQKTLRELRELECEFGSMEDLKNRIEQKQFIQNQENANTIVIETAQMKIEESTGEMVQKSNAPDHLLRLFVYNKLMKNISANYFKERYITEESISEAKTAYIVSPVSSLVVLETEADYKRFNISKSNNSLGNASMHSEGAVPEPEEWALIILCLGAIVYVFVMKRV